MEQPRLASGLGTSAAPRRFLPPSCRQPLQIASCSHFFSPDLLGYCWHISDSPSVWENGTWAFAQVSLIQALQARKVPPAEVTGWDWLTQTFFFFLPAQNHHIIAYTAVTGILINQYFAKVFENYKVF